MPSPPTPLSLTLDGDRFQDIGGFYAEINRVFMADEDWQLGPSLDALDDLLYGSYGVARDASAVQLTWLQFEKSRQALGVAATRDWLQAKLAQPDHFNAEGVQRQLQALQAGGPTYFDIVLEILASHPHITLRPA
ncbi:ribonuclease inhibitor [Stenotrophomonas sp. 24(2023)]|uniref:barstar family protein n=1 Tax=Stenotrophomonas sp. 24(2023) TaxID=3068324 RepID=UPI0027DEBC92|nr:ribonuclease inhibitor [Stenotrophomonas sp. 24(2023)]WMJ69906.1 ribonuclease inhibitor [Stenotrophomonas sp. 24(2023)]